MENQENRGYLFKNDTKSGRQPDLKGKITINGKEYWLSAWNSLSREGKEMISLSVTDPDTFKKPEQQVVEKKQEVSSSTSKDYNYEDDDQFKDIFDL